MASTDSSESMSKIAGQNKETENAPKEAKNDMNGETPLAAEPKNDSATKTAAPVESETALKPAEPIVESRKRPSEEVSGDNDQAKRARSDEGSNATTSANDSSSTSPSPSDSSADTNGDFVDRAVELGFKTGDRLVVEWDVEIEGQSKTHQWGATLMAHDGRSREGFAIRTLDYDPFPAGGYTERSQEDVVFVTDYILLTPDGTSLNFRREGEDEIVDFREDDINEMLANALKKNSAAWSKLDPAQRARMGSIVAAGKERLLEAITKRCQDKPGQVITSEEIPEILEKAFAGM